MAGVTFLYRSAGLSSIFFEMYFWQISFADLKPPCLSPTYRDPALRGMFLRGVTRTRISFNHSTCHILSRLSPISDFFLAIDTSRHHLESKSGPDKHLSTLES
jgi:hypothetical protein